MVAPMLALLLISGPPAANSNKEAAELIAADIGRVLADHNAKNYDIEVGVRQGREVFLSGSLNQIDDLKALLDAVAPHTNRLTLRVSVGLKPANPPFSGHPAGLEQHRIIEWDDGAWQKSLRLRPSPTSNFE